MNKITPHEQHFSLGGVRWLLYLIYWIKSMTIKVFSSISSTVSLSEKRKQAMGLID